MLQLMLLVALVCIFLIIEIGIAWAVCQGNTCIARLEEKRHAANSRGNSGNSNI